MILRVGGLLSHQQLLDGGNWCENSADAMGVGFVGRLLDLFSFLAIISKWVTIIKSAARVS